MEHASAPLSYTIRRAQAAVPLAGTVAGTPWQAAAPLTIGQYPWYRAGLKQPTATRLLYDDQCLYVQYLSQDRHSFAEALDLNGSVWRDSCVEVFASIDPAAGPDYFNLEINCCGTMLMGFGPGRSERKPITPDLAGRVRIRSSLPGPTKTESPDDRDWWIAVALPFDVIRDFTGKSVQPACGTAWRANFYRCGGRTDPQYASWSPIITPKPDFHRPEFFSPVVFE